MKETQLSAAMQHISRKQPSFVDLAHKHNKNHIEVSM
jgi:hypothetical protein